MTNQQERLPFEVFEGARIGRKNFRGDKDFRGQRVANPADAEKPSFRIYLTEEPERATDLYDKGYNIKGGDPIPDTPGEFYPQYIEVAVSYEPYMPDIYVFDGPEDKNPRVFESGAVAGSLDSLRFANVDVEIRPYQWSVGGKQGTKAYLRRLFVTIDKESTLDPLTKKYGF